MMTMYSGNSLKYLIIFAFLSIATVNFIKTTLKIMESSKRYNSLKEEVSLLEKEKIALNTDIDYMQTDAFIEEEARNKLSLVKSGEDVFLSPVVLSESVNNYSNIIKEKKAKSNILLWVEVFL